MGVSRREFLASVGGAGLVFAFRFRAGAGTRPVIGEPVVEDLVPGCTAFDKETDYSEWIYVGLDGVVTAFTGRTELGQGLRTVIYSVLMQGLDLPEHRINVVMGDTDSCPDDGPTTGSSATRYVGWGMWLACDSVRTHLSSRGAAALGLDESEVVYSRGRIESRSDPTRSVSAFGLGGGQAVLTTIDTSAPVSSDRQYQDPGLRNVLGKDIVTGRIEYAGDLEFEGMLYGAYLIPPYHRILTRLQSADLEAARAVPGVAVVDIVRGKVAVCAETYPALQKGLAAVEAEWSRPSRPQVLRNIEEIREGAELYREVEQSGNVDAGLASSDFVLSETYSTQYMTQCPIETDTAVASVDGSSATVWASCQYPHLVRTRVADALGVPASGVRVIGMQVGGGFGGKTASTVNPDAALLSRLAGRPVKYVYSREDQFNRHSRYKESCVFDITTGVDSGGRMVARRLDIHQDEGYGTTDTYDIPNVSTRLFHAEMPVSHATSRGTSYVQDCFATESHVDQVAHAAGFDPWEFRRQNVFLSAFTDLLDACAEMSGYHNFQPAGDRGIGIAICNHGGRQMGAFAVEVGINTRTGKVSVERVCAAFDIGTVICQHTLTIGIRGAIMWGIGYALMEEIELDGHRSHTKSLGQYRIPRFGDVPRIDIRLMSVHDPGGHPRGCGELPVVPTIPAIANAVYNATGIRFFSTPITPARLRRMLRL